MNKILENYKKHKELYILESLLIACYFFLFHNLGNYNLIDVDETRYASMAREILERSDWITMYFNHSIFYEKPPLYFWLVASSYLLFGKITEFSARFPITFMASITVFSTYYFGRKMISRTFGLLSALILLSSLEFLILAKISIIDMLLTTFTTISIYFGFLTFFSKEENVNEVNRKKYFWWLAWFFCALAVLAKGLPGLIIPFGVLGFSALVTGSLKDMFKIKHIFPGIIIFFIITLPWHIIMYQIHGKELLDIYIIKHHFARFFTSEDLGRKENDFYFLPVLAIGFLPWTFSFVAGIINSLKYLVNSLKSQELGLREKIKNIINPDDSDKKFLVLTACYFLVVFIFFSLSSTKLPTYILPLFPAVSLLTAYYWYKFILDNKYSLGIKSATAVFNLICICAGISAIFVIPTLNQYLQFLISPFEFIFILWFTLIPALCLILLYLNDKKKIFISQFIFMAGVVIISMNYVIPLAFNLGENELVDYAKYVKSMNNSKLVTFDFGVRSSTLFYYGKKVYFIVSPDYKRLQQLIDKNEKNFVIIKTKNLDEISKNMKFSLIKVGKKYSLIKLKKS